MFFLLKVLLLSTLIGAITSLCVLMAFPSLAKGFRRLIMNKSKRMQEDLKKKATSRQQRWFLQNTETLEIEVVGFDTPILEGKYKPLFINFRILQVLPSSDDIIAKYPSFFVEGQEHMVVVYLEIPDKKGSTHYYEAMMIYEIDGYSSFAEGVLAKGVGSRDLYHRIISIVETHVNIDFNNHGPDFLNKMQLKPNVPNTPSKIWGEIDKHILAPFLARVTKATVRKMTKREFKREGIV
jgi:hypothetical protein